MLQSFKVGVSELLFFATQKRVLSQYLIYFMVDSHMLITDLASLVKKSSFGYVAIIVSGTGSVKKNFDSRYAIPLIWLRGTTVFYQTKGLYTQYKQIKVHLPAA